MGDVPVVEMVVVKVSPYLSANRPLLWLCEKDANRPRLLPIAIGQFEAAAIQMQLDEEEPPRPIAYDLLSTVLRELSAGVRQVVIHSVRRQTFYARVVIEADDRRTEIDSRPSDAVALALRTGSPIFVNQALLEQAGLESLEDDPDVEHTMARFYEIEPQIATGERESGQPVGQKPSSGPAVASETDPSAAAEAEEAAEAPLEEAEAEGGDVSGDGDGEAGELSRLQEQLEQAVLCEEYEAAARLRDKIDLLVKKDRP